MSDIWKSGESCGILQMEKETSTTKANSPRGGDAKSRVSQRWLEHRKMNEKHYNHPKTTKPGENRRVFSVFQGLRTSDCSIWSQTHVGFIVLCLFFVCAIQTVFAQEATITDLGDFGGPDSYALDVNDQAQVAGMAADVSLMYMRPFVWEDGVLTDLGTLGGSYGEANAINQNEQVAGFSYTEAGLFADTWHAFLWDAGSMVDLGTLGGTYSSALAVNDQAAVAGFSYVAGDNEYRAFLWIDGVITDLGTLGGFHSVAEDINNSRMVVGWASTPDHKEHAFLYADGLMTDLGTLGGTRSEASAINQAGQVAGWAMTATEAQHAFLFIDGVMTDLGTLGGTSSAALGMNDNGQVVGWSLTATGERHAFLWENGVMTDLQDLLPADHTWEVITDANAVNASGQIAGWGILAGVYRAFLLSLPVLDEEPVLMTIAERFDHLRMSVTDLNLHRFAKKWLLRRLDDAEALLSKPEKKKCKKHHEEGKDKDKKHHKKGKDKKHHKKDHLDKHAVKHYAAILKSLGHRAPNNTARAIVHLEVFKSYIMLMRSRLIDLDSADSLIQETDTLIDAISTGETGQ